MYVIYALIDPRDNTVHYVGQTSDVYARFQQHINGNGSLMKNAWIFELRAANKMVIMETLEEVETYQEAMEREAYWIKHFEMLREPLTNATHRAALKKIKREQLRAAKRAATQAFVAIRTSQIAESTRRAEEKAEMTQRASAINSLKAEEKALTMHAILRTAGLTRHQTEEVAVYYGYDLVLGTGRPRANG